MTDVAASLFLLLQIFFVDLLLGADNAIVIALACGRLRPEDTRRAIMLGAGGAIVLRLVMLLFANALLGVPLVKLAGAWMLLVIALNVRAEEGGDDETTGRSGAADFVSAAAIIMLADAAMSLDNVVALAAIAGGNLWLLALGVLMSIPILVWGAFILTGLLRVAPAIFAIGAAFLGWIAGGMAATDPLVSGWIDANAPALGVFAPALGALFVLAAGRGKPPPAPAPRPLPAAAPAESPPAPAPSLAPTVPEPPLPAAMREPPAAAAPLRASSPPSLPAPLAADLPPPLPAAPPAQRAAEKDAPRFAEDAEDPSGGWSEERLVVAGFVLLALVAGLIIFVASFFDSLT